MVDVYGTLGPACASADVLEDMLRQGMTGVRLNLSHVTLPEAAPMVEALREAGRRCGCTPKLLIDMQGPELRICPLPAPIELREGETVPLSFVPAPIREAIGAGQEILLDDGKLLLRAADGEKARVLRGGTLASRKSIALPGLDLHLPPLTAADRDNLALAREYGVTGVMQPFVRCRADLQALREALDENGGAAIRIFAKIENREGVAHLEELLPAADEIVIARGDLGNSGPLWELPALQKTIAAACRSAKKPFMVVTQMLASMERSPVPTRAEVSDIFNAVLDGAASVMLTGETAVGAYPVDAIRYLAQTVREGKNYVNENM